MRPRLSPTLSLLLAALIWPAPLTVAQLAPGAARLVSPTSGQIVPVGSILPIEFAFPGPGNVSVVRMDVYLIGVNQNVITQASGFNISIALAVNASNSSFVNCPSTSTSQVVVANTMTVVSTTTVSMTEVSTMTVSTTEVSTTAASTNDSTALNHIHARRWHHVPMWHHTREPHHWEPHHTPYSRWESQTHMATASVPSTVSHSTSLITITTMQSTVTGPVSTSISVPLSSSLASATSTAVVATPVLCGVYLRWVNWTVPFRITPGIYNLTFRETDSTGPGNLTSFYIWGVTINITQMTTNFYPSGIISVSGAIATATNSEASRRISRHIWGLEDIVLQVLPLMMAGMLVRVQGTR